MVCDAVEMSGLVMTSMVMFSFSSLLQGYSRIWAKRQHTDLQRASLGAAVRPCEVPEPSVCPVCRLKQDQLVGRNAWVGYSAPRRFQRHGHTLSLCSLTLLSLPGKVP